MPGYNATASDVASASSAQSAGTESTVPTAPQTLMSAEGDTALPEQIAYFPTQKPGTPAEFAIPAPADAQSIASATPQSLVPPPQSAEQTEAVAQKVAAGDTQAITTRQGSQAEPAAPAMDNAVYVTAGEMPAPQQKQPPAKKSFLASFFGSAPAAPARAASAQKPDPIVPPPAAKPQPIIEPDAARQSVTPIVQLASADAGARPLVSLGSENALPGVRQTALFEIRRRSGVDDDSDVDLNEDEGSGPYQVASAAGMARLAPNGLLKQTESVDVACLKPSLVRVLKTIEGHYGRKMIVTSGYRDPDRNRRARGAKNSMHMYCAAADIQIPGVSKWELANYVRSMPGRGGVGTYCHTESVHVDVGPERDWNWRCRRRN
nr:D-Ala-D-Ala carboxypeptidase family metallohydrolase [Mesorhizobium sp.]